MNLKNENKFLKILVLPQELSEAFTIQMYKLDKS